MQKKPSGLGRGLDELLDEQSVLTFRIPLTSEPFVSCDRSDITLDADVGHHLPPDALIPIVI